MGVSEAQAALVGGWRVGLNPCVAHGRFGVSDARPAAEAARTGHPVKTRHTGTGRWGAERGATLAEFAFTLPFLAVILYAIFDFGGALTLKQKLEQAVFETTRLAASQSTDDFSSPTVTTDGSIADLRDTVARNLQAAGVDDCGLLGAAASSSNASTAVWVYTANGGACPAPLILTIQRQNSVSVGGVLVFYSKVAVQYPFQYHLAAILSVFSPGSSFPTSTNLVVNASMKNLM